MSCTSPLLAVDFGFKEDRVTRNIKLLPKRVDFSYQRLKDKYGDKLMLLPCGSCDACILARRKLWSLRCYAESLYHEQNCFVTLTYDDAHVPQELLKADFQKFIKTLRNYGYNVRYYGCGEYGSHGTGFGVDRTQGRPHYHIVLFGFFPFDAVYYSKSKSGFPQYSSRTLTNIWNKGMVMCSEFSPEVAAYVAGYVDKKYKQKDCFTLMSKRPGLGERYFFDHYLEFYEADSLVTNFGSHVSSIPRYFDKLAEKIGLDLSAIKDNRIHMANIMVHEMMRDIHTRHFEEFCMSQDRIFKDKLERKKRGL